MKSFDMNLLTVFEALFEERSVTRAALRLDLTSSAVSHALRRLRQHFDDPLFVRTGDGMLPTPQAARIAPNVRRVFMEVEDAIGMRKAFDPATARRSFLLRTSDYITALLLPPLCIYLTTRAPGISLSVHTHGERQISDKVEYEGVDVKLSTARGRLSVNSSRRILDDRWMVLMRRDHPAAAGEFTLAKYLEQNHLKVTGVGSSVIDETLSERGLARKIMLQVPSWAGMLSVIESTDIVAAIPGHWLNSMVSRADCIAHSLPLPDISLAIDAVWHPRNQHDAGHIWFRELIQQVFQEAFDRSRQQFPE